jgi:hypothetical protein
MELIQDKKRKHSAIDEQDDKNSKMPVSINNVEQKSTIQVPTLNALSANVIKQNTGKSVAQNMCEYLNAEINQKFSACVSSLEEAYKYLSDIYRLIPLDDNQNETFAKPVSENSIFRKCLDLFTDIRPANIDQVASFLSQLPKEMSELALEPLRWQDATQKFTFELSKAHYM